MENSWEVRLEADKANNVTYEMLSLAHTETEEEADLKVVLSGKKSNLMTAFIEWETIVYYKLEGSDFSQFVCVLSWDSALKYFKRA